MATTLKSLEGRLTRVSERLETSIVDFVASLAGEIGDELVPATPVDTGFARGNWRPTINLPATTPVTFNDPTGAATMARIRTVGRTYRLGQTLYITNNVGYINSLNEGSSPQAPKGFVQLAVRKGRADARRKTRIDLGR